MNVIKKIMQNFKLCLLATIGTCSPVSAEVVLDGSLGPAGNIPAFGGVVFQIPSNFGQTLGSNLFHSFDRFNIAIGQAATFTGPGNIDNIIARVTGGMASNIDGPLVSAIQTANLWFINPAGVLFGPHASINVDGSVYISTANYIKFDDNVVFNTSTSTTPILTSANPEAFGFLQSSSAPVEINGTGSTQATASLASFYGPLWNEFRVANGKTFAIVGGDINITDGQLFNGTKVAARLQAPGGRLALVSTASAGEVQPNSGQIDTSSFNQLGHINIKSAIPSQPTFLDTSATGGGEIVIRGGELALDNAILISDTFGNADGKTIDVKVRNNLTISNSAGIISETDGSGNAGNISLQADALKISSSGIFSEKSNFSSGRGGEIIINATRVELKQFSIIDSFTGNQSTNQGGSIEITADNLIIREGSIVQSGSGLSGTANGGAISITANNQLIIRDGVDNNDSGIFSNGGDGDAGAITIQAGTLLLKNGAQIAGDPLGSGAGADITINAKEITLESNADDANSKAIISSKTPFLSPNGTPGTVAITADEVNISGPRSGITTVTSNSNQAGAIVITAGNLRISGGIITSQTLGSGSAGDIQLYAGDITLTGQASIRSDNFLTDNTGRILFAAPGASGRITITADRSISANNATFISTATASEGQSGSISLATPGEIKLSNLATFSSSSFYTAPADQTTAQIGKRGKAGDITVSAGKLTITGPSGFGAETTDGLGGNINVNTENLAITEGGVLSTTSQGRGQAGNILIRGLSSANAKQVLIDGLNDAFLVDLSDGRLLRGQFSGIYLNASGSGNGGSLDLRTDDLQLSNGGLISAITAFGANLETTGGDITIQTGTANLSSGGLISAATSGLGSAGNIRLLASGPVSISGQFDRSQHPLVNNPRITDNSGINNSASFALDNRAQNLGAGGSIEIQTSSLNLSNGGEISVANAGANPNNVGGSITINAGREFISNNGRVSAETASAQGGNINLLATNLIHLTDSSISTSVAGGNGSGGNIFIDPEFLILDNSRITAQALRGAGGNIRIIADQFIQTPDSLVSASSEFGVDGNVVISSPDTNILGKTAVLAAQFIDPSSLFKQQCIARYAAGLSSMSVQALANIHPAPGEALAEPSSQTSGNDYSSQTPATCH